MPGGFPPGAEVFDSFDQDHDFRSRDSKAATPRTKRERFTAMSAV
jgi:hypothetical protein